MSLLFVLAACSPTPATASSTASSTATSTFAATVSATVPVRQAAGKGVVFGGTHFLHDDTITGAAFSPDSRHLYTLDDEKVRRWELATGVGELLFKVPCSRPLSLAADPEGGALAFACDTSILVLDLAGVVKSTLAVAEAEDLVWDGGVIGARVDESFVMWSIQSNQALTSMPVDHSTSWRARDGRWVVSNIPSGDDRSKVAAFDAKGNPMWELLGSSVDEAAFSVDGTRLLVSLNANVAILDPATGKEVAYAEVDNYAGNMLAVGDAFWAADRDEVIPVSLTGTLGKSRPLANDHLMASPDGKWVVDVGGARARVFTADGVRHLGGEGLEAVADQVVAESDWIVAASSYESVRIQRSTGVHLPVDLSGASAVALLPDGQAAFASNDAVVLVSVDGQQRKVEGLNDVWGIDLIHFSPDGKWLWMVSSMRDSQLYRIDVEAARLSVVQELTSGPIGRVDVVGGAAPELLLSLPDGRLRTVPLSVDAP